MKKKKGVIIGCFIVLVIIIQSLFIYNNIDSSKLMTGYRVISFTKIAIFGIFDLFVLLYAAAIIIQGAKGANESLYRFRYAILAVLFICLISLKLNFSSIAMWNNYVHSDKTNIYQEDIIFGKARAIRSDEWLVQTPAYLSQGLVQGNPYPLLNKNLSTDGTNMIIEYYSPVKDILTLGKPFNWGFLFLSPEYGFSWYWLTKIFLLFLFSFETCMILTKKNRIVSLFGALIILFSSAAQWWLSTVVVDLIVLSQMIIVNLNWYLNSKKWYYKIIFCLGILIGATGFIFELYPPIQVPLGIMTLIFMFYIFKNDENFKKLKIFDYIMILSVSLFLAFFAYHFYLTSYDQIKLMQNTVYPGKRVSLGGGEQVQRLLYYLFSWMIPFKDITGFSNNSEASSFFTLFPFVPGIFLFVQNKIYKEYKLIKYLLYFSVFELIWMFISFPQWFAKISLLSFVTNERLEIVFGLTCIYLLVAYISISGKIVLKSSVSKILIMINLFLMIFVFKSNIYEYLGRYYTLLTLVYINMIIILILKKKGKLAVVLIALFVIISGISVNPLAKGLGPIYNNKVSEEIIKINAVTKGTWVGANDMTLGNYLIANGVKSYNCVNYYPDFSKWNKIDPSGKYSDIYNRYAHIQVNFTYGKTAFVLNGNDSITVNMSYDDLINKTDIDFVMSKGQIDEKSKYRVIKKIYYDEGSNLYFYKVQRDAAN
jgi:hypothetical protein